MVRFQTRWINKKLKGKNRRYGTCSVNLPVALHERVQTKMRKDFDVEWNEYETNEQEIIILTFKRNKLAQPSAKQTK